MECFGAARGPVASNRGTLHGPGYAGAGVTREYLLPGGRGIDSDFYVFSIEWVADRVRFFVDNHQYLEATPNDLPPRGAWVFNGAKFFMLLNLPSVDRQHQSGNQTEQRPSRSPCLWTTFGFTSVAGDRAHARYTLPTMRDQHPAKVGAIE